MEKILNVNCYSKNGKKFLVLKSADGKTYSVNCGLVDYAIKNYKEVKNNENSKTPKK